MVKTASEKRFKAFLDKHKPTYLVGVDEVSYGSFASCLYVCAYVTKVHANLDVKDSKKYGSRKKLHEAANRLMERPDSFYVLKVVTVEELNSKGLGPCLAEAFQYVTDQACQKLNDEVKVSDAVIVVDGIRSPKAEIPILALPKADALVSQVSAASVIAKSAQLKECDELDIKYPLYGFCRNSGYGTEEHRDAIKKYGIQSCHRTYIEWIRELIDNGETQTIE